MLYLMDYSARNLPERVLTVGVPLRSPLQQQECLTKPIRYREDSPIRERRTPDDEAVAMRLQDGLLERIGRGDSRNVTGEREWTFPIGVSSVTEISLVFYPSPMTVAGLTDVPRESRE